MAAATGWSAPWWASARALLAGSGGSRKLSCVDQGRRDVVPAEGTGVCNRPVQLRHECRRHRRRSSWCRLAVTFGWQAAFLAIGLLGLVWLVLLAAWLLRAGTASAIVAGRARLHPRGSPPAQTDAQPAVDPAAALSADLAIPLGKLITDPVWWFFLFWLPSFLERERGQNPLSSAPLLALIYTARRRLDRGRLDVGTSDQARLEVGSARMTTMLIARVCMPGSIVAYYTDSFALCVAFITLATACHQAWSANVFTLAIDLFPRRCRALSSASAARGGIGGMFMIAVRRARGAMDRQSADRVHRSPASCIRSRC